MAFNRGVVFGPDGQPLPPDQVECIGGVCEATCDPAIETCGVTPPDIERPACTQEPCEPEGSELPAPSSRFPRLTHIQYANTVRDLLRLDQVPGEPATFLKDPNGEGHFSNQAYALNLQFKVEPRLWEDYQVAAEQYAEGISQDAAARDRLMPGAMPAADAPLQERARAFITGFGRRAFRRPLSTAEVDRYARLFGEADELFPGGDAFTDGVRLVIQTMLQSPKFIYRVETGVGTASADGAVKLSGYERAARLSYALWRTMPDDTLLDAAEAGELDTADGLRVHVERMVNDARSESIIKDFHAELFQFEQYAEVQKRQEDFPNFVDGLAQDYKREAELFVEDVVLRQGKGITELLTASYSYVNRRTAPVYGLNPEDFSDEFQRVDLDPTQRAGLLTQPGWLAKHSIADQPHTIKRGVFVNHYVLCTPIPEAPGTFDVPEQEGGATNRQVIDKATAACGGACHVLQINPAGFAFEQYDAIGQFREMDNGEQVDPSGLFRYGFELEIEFSDAVSFSSEMAASEFAHRCYGDHWLQYVFERPHAQTDDPLVSRLGRASLEGELSARQLLVELLTSDAFLFRVEPQE